MVFAQLDYGRQHDDTFFFKGLLNDHFVMADSKFILTSFRLTHLPIYCKLNLFYVKKKFEKKIKHFLDFTLI